LPSSGEEALAGAGVAGLGPHLGGSPDPLPAGCWGAFAGRWVTVTAPGGSVGPGLAEVP